MPSFRRYDVQARFGLLASLAALVPLLAAAAAGFRNYNHDLRAISYGEFSMFKPTFLVCIGLTLLLSAVGLSLGFNSAGQRRNKDSGKSWAGFFLGTAILSAAIILFAAFRILGFEVKAA